MARRCSPSAAASPATRRPGQDDRLKLGGGLGLASPFGTFYAPNISPDKPHGIGAWSELAFVNALLRGVGREGEHLYPALPYTSYQRMTSRMCATCSPI